MDSQRDSQRDSLNTNLKKSHKRIADILLGMFFRNITIANPPGTVEINLTEEFGRDHIEQINHFMSMRCEELFEEIEDLLDEIEGSTSQAILFQTLSPKTLLSYLIIKSFRIIHKIAPFKVFGSDELGVFENADGGDYDGVFASQHYRIDEHKNLENGFEVWSPDKFGNMVIKIQFIRNSSKIVSSIVFNEDYTKAVTTVSKI